MPNPRLLTTHEVAARTGVSVRTVARWASSGVLAPSQKLPGARGAFLFHVDTVDQYIAEQYRSSRLPEDTP